MYNIIFLISEVQSLNTLLSFLGADASLFGAISVGYFYCERFLNPDFDYKEGIKEIESLKKEIEEKI